MPEVMPEIFIGSLTREEYQMYLRRQKRQHLCNDLDVSKEYVLWRMDYLKNIPFDVLWKYHSSA